MRRSRGSGGKRVTGLEFGFSIFQAFAVIFLLTILFQYLSAKTTFEEGVEYLPITVTYDSVEKYTVKEADGDRTTKYECHYVYEVDGVKYEKTEDRSTSISEGTQIEKYYNPNNPSKISGYRSAEEMLGTIKAVIVAFGIVEFIAIVFLVLIIRRKRKNVVETREYEAQIRQDMERNIEKYNHIHILIDHQRAFEILEPLRKKVENSRKKVERLVRWSNVAVGGNVIMALIYIVLRMIAQMRIDKAKDILAGHENEFYKEYKKMIAEPVLNHLFDDYQYRPSQGFSTSELTSFKLYKESVRLANSEDFAFAGRVSVYDFNKDLNGEICTDYRGIEVSVWC